tara:strand:- start:92 stop:346 length:255 start_codon:yes stop_codon:yes gene_type:complete
VIAAVWESDADALADVTPRACDVADVSATVMFTAISSIVWWTCTFEVLAASEKIALTTEGSKMLDEDTPLSRRRDGAKWLARAE